MRCLSPTWIFSIQDHNQKTDRPRFDLSKLWEVPQKETRRDKEVWLLPT